MKRLPIIALALFFALSASFRTARAETKDYESAKQCYWRLLSDEGAKAAPNRWTRCIDTFLDFQKGNTKDPRSAGALFSAGKLSQKRFALTGDRTHADEAVKIYNKLIQGYPKSSLSDDALYQVGCMRRDVYHQEDRSRKAFSYIIEHYPQGDMIIKAKAGLASLETASQRASSTAPIPKPGPELISQGNAQEATSEQSPTDQKGEKPQPQLIPTEKTQTKDSNPSDAASHPIDAAPAAQTDTAPVSDLLADPFNKATLRAIDIQREGSGTTVTLSLDRPVESIYDFTPLGKRTKSPPRLDLYLLHTDLPENLKEEGEGISPELTSYAVKRRLLGSGLRIIFTLVPGVAYDVERKGAKVFLFLGDAVNSRDVTIQRAEAASTVQSPSKPFSSFHIVIDPGHGGEETGAVGKNGTQEKDVTLKIAKHLAKTIQEKIGAEVTLTRTDDRTLSLDERDAIAIGKKADLFISIHANASETRTASGIETYYLNNATDEAARRLAARENKASRKKMGDVEHIISTMLQNYDTLESQKLARNVQGELARQLGKRYGSVKNRGIRSALFYVLVGAKCPAILIETAFISNPREEELLRDKAYQRHLSSAITKGIETYFKGQEKALVSL